MCLFLPKRGCGLPWSAAPRKAAPLRPAPRLRPLSALPGSHPPHPPRTAPAVQIAAFKYSGRGLCEAPLSLSHGSAFPPCSFLHHLPEQARYRMDKNTAEQGTRTDRHPWSDQELPVYFSDINIPTYMTTVPTQLRKTQPRYFNFSSCFPPPFSFRSLLEANSDL